MALATIPEEVLPLLTAAELADLDGLTFDTVWVTASMARDLLGEMIDDNRNVKKGKLATFTKDMKRGKWRLNGDVIRYNRSGKLIDGQHRLKALIASGIAGLPMTICRGVPDDAITTVDTGSARTFADMLKMRRRSVGAAGNRNVLGAIVRRVYMWDKGNPLASNGVLTNPSHDELLEYSDADAEGFAAAAARGEDLRRAKVCGATVAGTMFYILARIDRDRAHQFFDALITGANLGPKHPILKLRDRLKDRNANDDSTTQIILFVRAWNHWRKDEEASIEKLVRGAGRDPITNANFPKPI